MSSEKKKKFKILRDQIHGVIEIKESEIDIINHPLFLRLRFIRHLGLANFVYPGAEHTRFAHSIGTMHVATLMARKLELDENEVESIRIGALLHDIGHYPLSHAIEGVLDIKHESLGEKIMKETSLYDILQDSIYDQEKIFALLNKSTDEPYAFQILSSGLDADRLDYLLRDCVNTGVDYGRIDHNRIINFLNKKTIERVEEGIKEKTLVVDIKARVSVENFLMARYFMYKTVYRHHSIHGFEHMAKIFFQKCQDRGILPKTLKEAVDKHGDGEFELFMKKFDDNWFFHQVREQAAKENDYTTVHGHLAYRILHRKPFRKAYERIVIPPFRDEDVHFIDFKREIEMNEIDSYAKWCFPVDKQLEISGHIMVELADERCVPLSDLNISIIKQLKEFKETTFRVFTIEKYDDEIRKIISDHKIEEIGKKTENESSSRLPRRN